MQIKKMKQKQEEETWVSEIKIHENGLQYKEIQFTDDITVKLFNTNKPGRLPEETQMEYKIRRKLNNNQLKEYLKGTPKYFSASRVPYVKPKEQ